MQELTSLPSNSSVGILHFGSPSFAQERLQERIHLVRQARTIWRVSITFVWPTTPPARTLPVLAHWQVVPKAFALALYNGLNKFRNM